MDSKPLSGRQLFLSVCHVIYCFHGPCGVCTLIRLQAVQKDHMVMNCESNVQPSTPGLTKQP
uniref:Putative ovule protein n=1 Tax=Solanum chacoense TaxID=4108 RepID=A0A0V0GZU6_SOLCH